MIMCFLLRTMLKMLNIQDWWLGIITKYLKEDGSLGDAGWKTLSVSHCISSIFDNSGPMCFCSKATRLYNSYNHTHPAGPHMWLSQIQGLWPYFKHSKTVEVRCSCWELDGHLQHPKKKNYREWSASLGWYTCASVSALRAQGHSKWLRGSREFQHLAGIEPM